MFWLRAERYKLQGNKMTHLLILLLWLKVFRQRAASRYLHPITKVRYGIMRIHPPSGNQPQVKQFQQEKEIMGHLVTLQVAVVSRKLTTVN